MMTADCALGEDPRLDLVQSYTRHQSCPGIVYQPGEDEPAPCTCSHHAMATQQQAPRRQMGWQAKGRLVLVAAVALLILWMWLR
jgi:hypothetical protein